MKLKINSLTKKSVKKSIPDGLSELSGESLNKIVGGATLDASIVACCCCYKYGEAIAPSA
ncbi:MAG: hypothetical protein WBB45_05080 [Cyclobacteriaceae bacterium]